MPMVGSFPVLSSSVAKVEYTFRDFFFPVSVHACIRMKWAAHACSRQITEFHLPENKKLNLPDRKWTPHPFSSFFRIQAFLLVKIHLFGLTGSFVLFIQKPGKSISLFSTEQPVLFEVQKNRVIIYTTNGGSFFLPSSKVLSQLHDRDDVVIFPVVTWSRQHGKCLRGVVIFYLHQDLPTLCIQLPLLAEEEIVIEPFCPLQKSHRGGQRGL